MSYELPSEGKGCWFDSNRVHQFFNGVIILLAMRAGFA